MNEPITERMPLVIAAEINRIKQQTCKIMLTNAIEIGKLFPAYGQQADAAL